MSWKLAEWRWREEARLRERSSWQIWSVHASVKCDDLAEDRVGYAFSSPEDEVGKFWQRRVELSRSGGLGSIRLRTNIHPPPPFALPALPPPQHHASYHTSQRSSIPLLASTEKTILPSGDIGSASSLISAPLSASATSISSADAEPRTPEIPQDFLDFRDWNHLAIDQKFARDVTVKQLRSSFGFFAKATQNCSPSRRRLSIIPRYHRDSAETCVELRSGGFPSNRTHLHKVLKSIQDSDFSLHPLQQRVIPWSNLETVFEEQQNRANNFVPSDTLSSLDNSINNSTSPLISESAMPRRFPFGKSEDDEETVKSKTPKRDTTPSARVYEDLPSAHSGIVGHSAALNKIPPIRNMTNMTGGPTGFPTLIDLPRTPPRAGPAPPEVLGKFAEYRATNSGIPKERLEQEPIVHPGYDDTAPVGDYVSRSNQIHELRRVQSQESGLFSPQPMIRNSKSFFDLAAEHRGTAHQSASPVRPCLQELQVPSRFSSDSSEVDGPNPTHPQNAENVTVRDSRDLIGFAISCDDNIAKQDSNLEDLAMPAPLHLNRRLRKDPGDVPRVSLPELFASKDHPREMVENASESGAADYEHTESILNTTLQGWHRDRNKDSEPGMTDSARGPAWVPQQTYGSLQPSHQSDVIFGHLSEVLPERDKQYAAHEASQAESSSDLFQPKMYFRGADSSITESYRKALRPILQGSGCNIAERIPAQTGAPGYVEPGEEQLTTSSLSTGDVSEQVATRIMDNNQVNDGECVEDKFLRHRNLSSGEWFANASGKKGLTMKEELNDPEAEDDCDWETVRGTSGAFLSPNNSQATIQPPYEPLDPATPGVDSRLTNMQSLETVSANDAEPTIALDPLPQISPTRVHPALTGTPHKYRVRRDISTGDRVLVPEYSVSEREHYNFTAEPVQNAAFVSNLPTNFTSQISKFSRPAPHPRAIGDNSLSDQNNIPSPLASNRRAAFESDTSTPAFRELKKQAMADANTQFECYELEGDQVQPHAIFGEPELTTISEANSVYSLTGDKIVQDEPFAHVSKDHNTNTPPANIAGTRVALSHTSDEKSFDEELRYGEEDDGVEMTKMGSSRSFSSGTVYNQFGSSQNSLGFQHRLMSQGRNESVENVTKRLSTIQDDGSYMDNEDVASISSILREHNPLTPRGGTFNKRSTLGIMNNITGSIRGTGMRITGSSPADVSPDTYDPAMQRRHSYGQLSSGPQSIDITNEGIQPAKVLRKGLARHELKKFLQKKGVDVAKIAWGNVQRDVTGVTFPNGFAISAPTPVVLPRTVPAINSFTLTKDKPLHEGTSAKEAEDRVLMGQDDWHRLKQVCPVFPLRDEHLDMEFVQGDPRAAGGKIYIRGGISRINGQIEEEAYCFVHKRREFSVLAALRPAPMTHEMYVLQKKMGREIVWTCLCIPMIGWVFLYYIQKQDPRYMISNDLMMLKTQGVIKEMGPAEIELAGDVMLWFAVAMAGVLFGCLGVLLWAFV